MLEAMALLLIGSPFAAVGIAPALISWRCLPHRVQSILRRAAGTPGLAAIAWLATCWTILALLLYACLRLDGSLPAPEEWGRSGYRHGPFRDSGLLYASGLFFVAAVLPFLALGVGALRAYQRRMPVLLARGFGVAGLSVSYAAILAYTTFWLVD
jgi:hypothetical protein